MFEQCVMALSCMQAPLQVAAGIEDKSDQLVRTPGCLHGFIDQCAFTVVNYVPPVIHRSDGRGVTDVSLPELVGIVKACVVH